MNLYLDDNSAGDPLVARLRKAGHTVVCPPDAGLIGAVDARHLEYAIRVNRVVLTADREDFRALHQLVITAGGRHPGILIVRYDNDPKRDMKAKHIAAAVGKLERSGATVGSQIIVLNQWR